MLLTIFNFFNYIFLKLKNVNLTLKKKKNTQKLTPTHVVHHSIPTLEEYKIEPNFFQLSKHTKRQRASSDIGVVGLARFQDEATQEIHGVVQFQWLSCLHFRR